LYANPLAKHRLNFYRRGAYTDVQLVQHGLWVGSASSGTDTVAATLWRPGGHVRVLGRYRYDGVSFGIAVEMAGVTPGGSPVGYVQRRHSSSKTFPVAYRHAHHYRAYRLAVHGDWKSTSVLAVTDRGAVLGVANLGTFRHPLLRIVRWSRVSAHPEVLRKFPREHYPELKADQRGDVVWSSGRGAFVRRPGGKVQRLVGPNDDRPYVQSAAGDYLFADSNDGLIRWEINQTSRQARQLRGQLVTGPEHRNNYPSASSRFGAIVDGAIVKHRHFQEFDGRRVRLGDEYYDSVGEAIPSGDSVAYTVGRDRLVHRLTCR
jgi:hypothetical protein